MEHVLVLAPGDTARIHWQQSGFRPTVAEVLEGPRIASSDPEEGLVVHVLAELNSDCSCAVCAIVREFLEEIGAASTPLSRGWRPVATAPVDGTPFRAFSPALINADFNPGGSVEAVFDGERIVGAVWDAQHDCWNTSPIEATYWMPLPGPAEPAE